MYPFNLGASVTSVVDAERWVFLKGVYPFRPLAEEESIDWNSESNCA